MDTWTRPANARLTEPTDDFIRRHIAEATERHNLSVEEASVLRACMLEGRDFSHKRIPRHRMAFSPSLYDSSLSEYLASSCSLPNSDQPLLTESVLTQTFSHLPPIGSNQRLPDVSSSKLLVLNPHDIHFPKPSVRLLGAMMHEGVVPGWSPSSFELQGSLSISEGQVEWTRFVLAHERDTLIRAGIYGSVFLSLFKYPVSVPLFQGFVSNWNYVTNTLFLEDRERTFIFTDLEQIGGLSVTGFPYGVPWFPDSLRKVFSIYYKIANRRRSKNYAVSFKSWFGYFMDKVKTRVVSEASVNSPLGNGAHSIYAEDLVPSLMIRLLGRRPGKPFLLHSWLGGSATLLCQQNHLVLSGQKLSSWPAIWLEASNFLWLSQLFVTFSAL